MRTTADWCIFAAIILSFVTLIVIVIYLVYRTEVQRVENKRLQSYIAMRDDQEWTPAGRHRGE